MNFLINIFINVVEINASNKAATQNIARQQNDNRINCRIFNLSFLCLLVENIIPLDDKKEIAKTNNTVDGKSNKHKKSPRKLYNFINDEYVNPDIKPSVANRRSIPIKPGLINDNNIINILILSPLNNDDFKISKKESTIVILPK